MNHLTKLLAVSLLLSLSGPLEFTAGGNTFLGVRADELVMIDTDRLTIALMGPVGISGVGGLAYGADRRLYGVATGADQLITINPLTGAGTVVGGSGPAVIYSTDLAADPTSGVIYGTSDTGGLITYSTLDGTRTFVGSTGAPFMVGLAFDAAGQLWGIDGAASTREELVRIDKFTATRSVVAPMGLLPFPNIGALAISRGGIMYAVNSGASTYELLTINSVTGTATKVGDLTGLPLTGIITGITETPEPSVALYAAASLLLLFRRRRRG